MLCMPQFALVECLQDKSTDVSEKQTTDVVRGSKESEDGKEEGREVEKEKEIKEENKTKTERKCA